MIAAVILAAGESRRMAIPKLLLPFREKTIIETVISNVIQSKAEEILVILGAESKKIEEKIKNFPVKITKNPHYRRGMLSSVQWGYRNLAENIEAVLICLGDQPSISVTTIDKVIKSYKKTKKGIVIPVYKNERGHPVLIDIKYRSEVENLNPNIGLRQLIYNHPQDTLEVKVKSPSILRDIDDVDDYERELKNS